MNTRTYFYVMLLVGYVQAKSILQDLKVGQPNFIYHNITNCSHYTPSLIFIIKFKLLNETYQVIDGRLHAPKPVGDDHLVSVTGKFLFGNAWVSTCEIPSLPFCVFLKNIFGPLRNDFYAALNLHLDTCPIPAGTHAVRNFHTDWRKSRLPALPSGEYNAIFKITEKHSKTMSSCLNIYLFNQLDVSAPSVA